MFFFLYFFDIFDRVLRIFFDSAAMISCALKEVPSGVQYLLGPRVAGILAVLDLATLFYAKDCFSKRQQQATVDTSR